MSQARKSGEHMTFYEGLSTMNKYYEWPPRSLSFYGALVSEVGVESMWVSHYDVTELELCYRLP